MKRATVLRDSAVLGALGLSELILAILAARVISRETTYLHYLALYFAMGVPWLLASYYAVTRATSSRTNRALVLVFAVAARIPFLVTEPILSDDIFRYVWDGRVQHAGINPYVYAPDAEELRFLRNAEYEGINNKDIPTIYPPLMQMAFFAATTVSERIVWMKAFFVLADLSLLFVLARMLSSLGLNPVRALIYGWSPLVIVEVAGSGHNDAFAVLLLMTAQWTILLQLPKRGLTSMMSMSLLALSGLAKLVGFALSPLFLRSVRRSAFAAMVFVSVAFNLPYAGAGTLALRGLTQYGLRWRGNDSLFHILYALTGSLDIAKMIVAVLLVLLVLVLVASNARPLRSSYLTLGAILVLMTTVHPWYLLWIAPFLAIYASPAWLFLSLSVALSYHSAYLATPGVPWEDVLWIKCLEYAPFFVIGVATVARDLSRGPGALRRFIGIDSPL